MKPAVRVGAQVGLALWWTGCAPATEDLLLQVARGDLDPEVLAVLADRADAGAVPELARTHQALSPTVAALAQAEGPLMVAAVEDALAAGRLDVAAGRLAVLLAASDAPRSHRALSDQLEAAARTADPTTTARVLEGLAAAWEPVPAQAQRLQADALQATVAARYTGTALPTTRAGQAGITRAAVADLFAELDHQYVTPVDWTASVSGATTRLLALRSAAPARDLWPGLSDSVFTAAAAPDVAAALRHLDQCLRLGQAAGVPETVLLDEYVAGALSRLDPWTRAVWPAELASWQQDHAGVYAGVGLLVEDGPGGSVVVDHPLPGAPAWDSGIHQGDRVLAIADHMGRLTVADLPPTDRAAVVAAALRGTVDTVVRLTVQADGADPRELALTRGPVAVQTVFGHRRQADNAWAVVLPERSGAQFEVGYVRIPAFKPTTEAAFDALTESLAGELHGLIIDLRGNPGGDVNSAVQVADRFVADGWLADLDGRVLPDTGPDTDPTTGEPLAAWNQAIPGHALEGTPVAVLVDGETASAAEVLAGALQERVGAVVVGSPTWGKGLAQRLSVDEDGRYGVAFTNAAWTLPSGRRLDRSLDGQGVVPDVVAPTGPAVRFAVGRLQAEREALRVHADGTPLTVALPAARADLPALSADPVLTAAELVLRARRWTDH